MCKHNKIVENAKIKIIFTLSIMYNHCVDLYNTKEYVNKKNKNNTHKFPRDGEECKNSKK